jgi:diguanylate cyclase (GGDEF)-like protein/PAS domain S-box-containing protein
MEQHPLSIEEISLEDWESTPDSVKRLVEALMAKETQALSASESLFTQFLDALPVGVLVHDATEQPIYINQAGTTILGTSQPLKAGTRQFSETLHVYRSATQEPYPTDQFPITRALRGETAQADDLELHRPDRVVPLEIAATPIFEDQGEVIYAIATVQDITERKGSEAKRQQAETALRESESRYRQVVQTQTDFILRSLPDTTITFANEALCSALGCSLEQITGQKWINFANPDDLQNTLENLAALTPENSRCLAENRDTRADGQVGWTQWINQGFFNEQGHLTEIQSVGRDITALKQVEAALRESETLYRLLAENINDLVCLHQPDGRLLYVSPSSESLLGYRYDELMGRDPYTFVHPDDRPRVYNESHTAALTGKPVPTTYRMRQKSGNYIWFETLTRPIVDAAGQIVQFQTTSRDVTERIQIQNRLRHDALHDSLTGLPNRNLLMERLELAVNRAKRLESYHFAVLFLDLDRFKVVNDSLGHLAGDQLLITIAHKLQSTLRATDLAVRLGGDEFVILLDEIQDIQEAVRATERIFAELRVPLIIEGRKVYTTTSIGIVFGTKDYAQPVHLLRDADIAMYRAKNHGKARYAIFDAVMHTQALQRLHLENDLRQAIDRQEFVLYYQPIVALDTNRLAGFEALVRWQHPTQGLKSPGEFVAVAEEIGLITPLDYWVLRKACEQLAAWQIAFPHLSSMKVSVNLSAQDLQRPDLLEEVDRVLAETHLDGRCLVLEITESMLIEDIEATIVLLERLKRSGIQISIDDFGTGYSSLSYLHRLPVDNLKVDRSFVNQMQEGKRNDQIVETIAVLSEQLELDAIAEGIETQQQLERLQRLGYKFGQGYLFSRPLSQEAAEALLALKNLY